MMRIAASTLFASLASASLADGEGVLAPADSKTQELKELLALDSFNVTSSDAEQNRMHAVCDMEYRLSKTRGIAGKGLGINNLLVTPAAPQFPWNPFTMPLAAVKAHIALLQQEEKYLQAQSDAWDGTSSSSASTTAAASTGITISNCKFVDQTTADTDTPAEATARVTGTIHALDGVACKMNTVNTLGAGQIMYVMMDTGESGSLTYTVPTIASQTAAAIGTGTVPCFHTDSAAAAADGGQCKTVTGTKMTGTDPTLTGAYAMDGTTALSGNAMVAVTSGQTYAKYCKNGGKCAMAKWTFANGLAKMENGWWVMGGLGAQATTNRKAFTICFKVEAGTNTNANALTGESCDTIAAIA